MTRSARSAPRRGRVRLSLEDRRRQLLELGMRAFTERPYDAVSIDEIAAEAGISRGLLFHYFPSKHEYYVSVLRVAADQLVRETVWDATGTPAERLAAGLQAYFRFVEGHARPFATLLRGGVGTDAAVQALVEATRRRFIDGIRVHLGPLAGGKGALVRASLRAWLGLVEALALDWIDHRDVARDELVALAARGLGLLVPDALAGARRGRRRR